MRHFRSALFLIVIVCTVCNGEGPAAFRRYNLGPLAIKEFRNNADDQNSRAAFTATRILYQLEYAQRPLDDGVVVTLTSVDIYAAFLPNVSWWGENANLALLDHEQGHFDIAEINVRKANLAFAKQMADGREIAALGASADDAYRMLSDKIEK